MQTFVKKSGKAIIILFYCFSLSSYAQTIHEVFKQAEQLSAEGYYEKSNALLLNILALEPRELRARKGLAYNYSWAGKQDQAIVEFEKALEIDPSDKQALEGYGYALAWNGDFANAKYPFLNLARGSDESEKAKKGLAYVYFWQGNTKLAGKMFRELLDEHAGNPEYYLALAQTYLAEYKTKSARAMFKQANENGSFQNSIEELIKSTYAATPFMDIRIEGGYSRLGHFSKTGLRAISASMQLSKSVRLLAEYDNSGSLDNLFLLRRNEVAERISGGVLADWNKHWSSRIQAGRRFFNGFGENLIYGEQIWYPSPGYAFQLGAQLSFSDVLPNTLTLHMGSYFRLASAFALHPVYYVSLLPAAQTEHRVLVNAIFYRMSGFELHSGVMLGRLTGTEEKGADSLYGGYIRFQIPVHSNLSASLMSRYENTLAGELLTTSLGIQIRIER